MKHAEKAVRTYIEQQLYFKNEEARNLGIFLGGQNALVDLYANKSTREALICKIKEQDFALFLTETQIDLLAKELSELYSMSKYRLSSQEKDGAIIIQIEIQAPDIGKIQQDVFQSSLKKCETKFPLARDEFSRQIDTLPNLMTCYGDERFFKHIQKISEKNGWSYYLNDGFDTTSLVENRFISFRKEISEIVMESYHEILHDSNKIPFKKLNLTLNASVENGNRVLIKSNRDEESLDGINRYSWRGFGKVIDTQKSADPNTSGDFSSYNIDAASVVIDGKNCTGYGHGATIGTIENTRISLTELADWQITAKLLGYRDLRLKSDIDNFQKQHRKDIEKVKNIVTYSKVDITTDLFLQNNNVKEKDIQVEVELCDSYGRGIRFAEIAPDPKSGKQPSDHIIVNFPPGKQEKIPLKIGFDMWQLKDSSSDIAEQISQNFMIHVRVIQGNLGYNDIYIPLNNQNT